MLLRGGGGGEDLKHVVAPVEDVEEAEEEREEAAAVLVDLAGLNLVGLLEGAHDLGRDLRGVVLAGGGAALQLGGEREVLVGRLFGDVVKQINECDAISGRVRK